MDALTGAWTNTLTKSLSLEKFQMLHKFHSNYILNLYHLANTTAEKSMAIIVIYTSKEHRLNSEI